METYTAGLIVVGDEILRGQIMDTNTSYLARSLRTAGITLRKVTVVPDIVDEIAQEVRKASMEYVTVFTTGGVGPTHDDVTYDAVAKALGLRLELHEEVLNHYAQALPDQPGVERFAIVPRPCELVHVNFKEPYMVIKAKNVYVLPGSPKYFEPAVDTIVPTLNAGTPLYMEHIDVALTELYIVDILDKHARKWKDKVKIGSYPQTTPHDFTRITLEGTKDNVLKVKEELICSFSLEKILNLHNGFNFDHTQSVFDDNETHVKTALNVLLSCYDMYKPDEIFISFNGGKDCTVVLHLAATIAKTRNISSLLCLYVTADPFPEVDAFVEKSAQYYGLDLVRKTRPMRQALASLLKEKKNLKASLMGMRRGDPGSENLKNFTPTDKDWPSLMRVNPILDWSYDQVWQFLLKYKVPYCSLYDRGYTSLGTKASTLPNPLLKDPNNPSSYLPAYTLHDKSAERQGRV